ncbi:type II 3-dehydroquinate dehydratase [Pelagovum pacificum]|uniref:3-dehydroquinate dehydratase n=1 Tax=Pelagovum pacificum TaxID=2588711 RepID=A0A5C5GL88_9RHOB|nr:type II 3-dehydroquinate dehydratase [Pelagovum pacificum]QQA42713.1 type II 3-dehydroquinate dehydratase [Pelagovum pacificum]TNY34136.1 type II 3-dehydroquinate dehydratase [Pelagovum pacificum]
MPTIHILNGPNLNLLGQRQPEVYGAETLADVEASCRKLGKELGVEIGFFQSNHEGEIVDQVHTARTEAQAIIINAGAYTHTSIAIADALRAFDGPFIEVHISNVHAREAFRHHSYLSEIATGVIVGCGTEGYLLALRHLVGKLG